MSDRLAEQGRPESAVRPVMDTTNELLQPTTLSGAIRRNGMVELMPLPYASEPVVVSKVRGLPSARLEHPSRPGASRRRDINAAYLGRSRNDPRLRPS